MSSTRAPPPAPGRYKAAATAARQAEGAPRVPELIPKWRPHAGRPTSSSRALLARTPGVRGPHTRCRTRSWGRGWAWKHHAHPPPQEIDIHTERGPSFKHHPEPHDRPRHPQRRDDPGPTVSWKGSDPCIDNEGDYPHRDGRCCR